METLDDFDPPAGIAVAVQRIEVLVRFLVAYCIFTKAKHCIGECFKGQFQYLLCCQSDPTKGARIF